MTRRAYQLAFALLGTVTLGSLMTASYWYGKSTAAARSDGPVMSTTARILIGAVTRIEPLHVYVETSGSRQEYDILIAPNTRFLQLSPWGPGERERAEQERTEYLKRERPDSGDPVPPPTPELKPEQLDPKVLAPGMKIGVLATQAIDPTQPIIAAVIRPLTPEEAATGRVAATFPL